MCSARRCGAAAPSRRRAVATPRSPGRGPRHDASCSPSCISSSCPGVEGVSPVGVKTSMDFRHSKGVIIPATSVTLARSIFGIRCAQQRSAVPSCSAKGGNLEHEGYKDFSRRGHATRRVGPSGTLTRDVQRVPRASVPDGTAHNTPVQGLCHMPAATAGSEAASHSRRTPTDLRGPPRGAAGGGARV